MFFLEVNLLNHEYIESRHVYDVMPYLTDPFSGILNPQFVQNSDDLCWYFWEVG